MDGVIVDFGKAVTDWFDKHPHLVDRYKGFPLTTYKDCSE